MRIGTTLLVLPMLVGLVACSDNSEPASPSTGAGTSTQAAAATTLTEPDAGKDVHLAPQETVIIRLGGNLSTGFSWRVTDSNPEVLESGGPPTYSENASATPKLGEPGVYIYNFTAKNAGTADLTFDYLREWETATPPAKTLVFHVTVG